jgi:hypothetical protein
LIVGALLTGAFVDLGVAFGAKVVGKLLGDNITFVGDLLGDRVGAVDGK